MGWLDPEELEQLLPAETSAFPSPIPTQSVSSDEFMPAPQTPEQREFEVRVKEHGAALARRQGMSRRAFFRTAAGMAAAVVAMNDTYGRLCAAMMGILIGGLGADHVCWGTDAIWTGSPQWQIEALRRLEIPEDMQKQYGFEPLGPADGPVKTAILGGNNARSYKYPIVHKTELAHDRFAQLRKEYEQVGGSRSNLTYGYIRQRLA